MHTTVPVLSVRGIAKSYGRQLVLDHVSFDLAQGEIAALLGENGAGKSTLAKILAGAVQPDEGSLLINGGEALLSSPREALSHGVALIPQELIYVPQLTVAENICLGRLPARRGITSPRKIQRQAHVEAAKYGFDLPLDRTMNSLPLAAQQQVEILKALAREAQIVLLDEPTAALSAEDSERLLKLTAHLAHRGVGVLYISHRLEEVVRVCHTAHVLRNGVLVQSGPVAETSPQDIVTSMLGRAAEEADFTKEDMLGRTEVMTVQALNKADLPSLNNVSLSVHKGEILGVYGIAGSGAETIAETLGGLYPAARGKIRVGEKSAGRIRSPLAARKLGIAYLPADRKSQGLVLLMPIVRAFALPIWRALSTLGIVSGKAEQAHARDMSKQTHLRAQSISQTVAELSGGNQQKVLVGSRLSMAHRILVLQEPTRGVDVGARYEIHRLLRDLAAKGTGQLLVTSDIEEAVNVSDRVLVVRDGSIVHQVARPGPGNQSEILHAAGGLE